MDTTSKNSVSELETFLFRNLYFILIATRSHLESALAAGLLKFTMDDKKPPKTIHEAAQRNDTGASFSVLSRGTVSANSVLLQLLNCV